ncbi:MAG: hypothetical protein AB1778_05230 [Candidatus Bipolaricaulota bacterium]
MGKVRWSVRDVLWALGMLVVASAACAQEPAQKVPDLSGSWAMIQILPAVAQLPFLGEVELTTVVVSRVDVEQDGLQLVLQDTYCYTDLAMAPPVLQSRVPERFIASLTPSPRVAALEWRDGMWTMRQEPYVEVRGAQLADPLEDPLPRDAYDPRVCDPDCDGHPGLTVPVCVAGLVCGETYVVQRILTELDGLVRSDGEITGRIDWQSEQNVLAASDLLLTMPYTYALHPDAARHRFAMVRVESEISCTALRELADELMALALSLAPPLG